MKTLLRGVLLFCLFCSTALLRAQTPLLSSYPSAGATIFLDFDGHLVDNTAWNMVGPIHCGPSNLTNTQIVEIYNRVAEDYRPFNVNVTTDSASYWAAPIDRRIRIILTITSEWYGAAGGVSYYGSFTWGDNTPAFVFTALLNYRTKSIAEATAHEIGHSLNLRHQARYDANCNIVSEYNSGVGSGEIGWAPIMGVGYSRNQTLWNIGADPYGCNSVQNDLEVITGSNGFGYRADDYNANFGGNATQVPVIGNQFTVNGVIEKSTDADVLRFTMPVNGRFALDALPFNVGAGNSGANLDVQVELMTSANNIIGTYNPDLLLNAFIDTNLNAGNYFLRVQGRGNANAPQFASLGAYHLQGRMGDVVLPLRRLQLQGRRLNNAYALQWTIDADEAVVKQVLEVSTDGRNFSTVATPLATERSASLATANGTTLYRLFVQFDNGRHYYSNTIALSSSNRQGPQLVSNQVQHSLLVRSEAGGHYQVADFSGRLVHSGLLQKGTTSIAAAAWAKGWYVLHMTEGGNQHAFKFLKQ